MTTPANILGALITWVTGLGPSKLVSSLAKDEQGRVTGENPTSGEVVTNSDAGNGFEKPLKKFLRHAWPHHLNLHYIEVNAESSAWFMNFALSPEVREHSIGAIPVRRGA